AGRAGFVGRDVAVQARLAPRVFRQVDDARGGVDPGGLVCETAHADDGLTRGLAGIGGHLEHIAVLLAARAHVVAADLFTAQPGAPWRGAGRAVGARAAEAGLGLDPVAIHEGQVGGAAGRVGRRRSGAAAVV